MVMFTIKNEQREHLKILRDKSCDNIVDLCKLAIDYLNNGPNEKKLNVVAKKMNISMNIIKSTIEALICLLIDTTEKNINENDFELIIKQTLGLTIEIISILWQFIISKKLFVKNILKCINIKRYRYRDLIWRFEGKISSRCYMNSSIPIITIKLYLDSKELIENRSILSIAPDNNTNNSNNTNLMTKNEDNDDNENINNTKYDVLIEIDPNNLIYLINVLEQALLESRNYRIGNITKTL